MSLSWCSGKLTISESQGSQLMNNLVGRIFSLADGRYRIVDVRRLNGDALVYAEREESTGTAAQPGRSSRSPGRTAFRYGDIAPLLDGRAGF